VTVKTVLNVAQMFVCAAVENVAYRKTKWVNSLRRSPSKRHVGHDAWLPATPPTSDVTSGVEDHVTEECVQLSSLYVDRPTLRVDLGRRMDVSGVLITGQKTTHDGTRLCSVNVTLAQLTTGEASLVYLQGPFFRDRAFVTLFKVPPNAHLLHTGPARLCCPDGISISSTVCSAPNSQTQKPQNVWHL